MRRLLAAGIAGLMMISLPAITLADEDQETYEQLDLFGDILERIRDEYVEEVSTSDLIDAAIEGMVGSLDPHSKYHNPKSYKEVQVQARGEFGGLGIEVTMENGLVKVIAPIDDTARAARRDRGGGPGDPSRRRAGARSHPPAGSRQDAGPRQLRDHAHCPPPRGGGGSDVSDHPRDHQDSFGARAGSG